MISRLSGKLFFFAAMAFFLFPAQGFAQSPLEKLKAATDQSSALPEADDLPMPRSPGLSLQTEGMSDTEDSATLDPFAVDVPEPPKPKDEVEALIRTQALNAAMTGLLPMNPDEIRKLLERYDNTQQAVEVPVYPYPNPEVVAETVSLDPGSKPPVLKIGVGHVTTLTVLDVTGAPWPIQDLTYAGNFEIVTPEEGGHILRITGMSEFGYGNISLTLLELKTPVTFTLKTSRDSVHYRFDARIPEYGPYAKAPLIDGGLTLVAGDSVLGAVLDGVPPLETNKLSVEGVDGRTTAYRQGQITYVRTPLTLLSPGWSGSVSSADGMNVYAVSNTPVLLLSDRGQVVHARLSEEDKLNEQ